MNDKKIDDYFKKNHMETKRISISIISKEIGVSDAAITRFCKKRGFSGFKEFSSFINKYYEQTSKIDNLLKSLLQTSEKIDFRKIKWIASQITNSKRIFLFGEAFTFYQCKIFENKLLRININAKAWNVASDLSMILPEEDSIYIFISHSGGNKNIKRAVIKLKSSNIKRHIFISITPKPISSIKNYCNEFIHGYTFSNNNTTETELPSNSFIVTQLILDYIYDEVFEINKPIYQTLLKRIKSDKLK